ncbi:MULTISPECIES: FeoA family protein [Caldisericum]|uniref:FeoA family protein n=1 Tax=Caldisericum TaxID=693074 RepID=UPI0039FCE676
MPLIFGRPNEEFVIEKILGGSSISLRLKEIGVIPGVKVLIVSNSGGPIVIGIGNMRLALGRGIASKIIVRKIV